MECRGERHSDHDNEWFVPKLAPGWFISLALRFAVNFETYFIKNLCTRTATGCTKYIRDLRIDHRLDYRHNCRIARKFILVRTGPGLSNRDTNGKRFDHGFYDWLIPSSCEVNSQLCQLGRLEHWDRNWKELKIDGMGLNIFQESVEIELKSKFFIKLQYRYQWTCLA